MAQKLTVEFSVRGIEEQREDRYTVRSEEFGFTVYGVRSEDARNAFTNAITTLMQSFGSDVFRLRDYLDKKGVHHRLARETAALGSLDENAAPAIKVNRPPRLDRAFEQPFEVLIGAA